ncbi:MAG: MBL fold metallo-hydrolase [Rhodospirillaceae bacterium]|nr:MBL fold metallo-hydrolase [Rhodospirillaceae bacterium]
MRAVFGSFLAVAALGFAGMAAAADKYADFSANPTNAPIPSVFGFAKFIKPEVTKVAEGFYTFSHAGARNVFIVTGKGVIMTDPLNPTSAKIMREEIRKVTDEPVKYVIYSHGHWDHAAGGTIFKAEGAKFVAQEKCVAYFKNFPNPDVPMPDITYKDRKVLKLGDTTLELMYLGPNHSDCLTFIRIKGTPYLVMVDMANPGSAPRGDMMDYSLHHWVRTLKEVEAMSADGVTTVIEGHGPPTAPLSAVAERREYLEALMAAVKAEMEKGTPSDKIADTVTLPQFAHLKNMDRYFKKNVDRVVSYYTIGY